MKKIAVLMSDGSEEIETLFPVDILRRAGVKCEIVSIKDEFLMGSHGIIVKSDRYLRDARVGDYDGIIIPGGMPGTRLISEDEKAMAFIEKAVKSNLLICAICAAPAVVLAKHNLLGGKKATCYKAEDFISLMGDSYTGNDVEVAENLITANGPKSAMNFGLKICESLGVTPKF